MITISPERKIEYSMNIIDATFFFLTNKKDEWSGFHFSFAGKHGREGEVEAEKDFSEISLFISKATNK